MRRLLVLFALLVSSSNLWAGFTAAEYWNMHSYSEKSSELSGFSQGYSEFVGLHLGPEALLTVTRWYLSVHDELINAVDQKFKTAARPNRYAIMTESIEELLSAYSPEGARIVQEVRRIKAELRAQWQ